VSHAEVQTGGLVPVTLFKRPKRIWVTLSDGRVIVTHEGSGEPPRAQPDPAPDTDPDEIVPPTAS
jgi:hypothetical protein